MAEMRTVAIVPLNGSNYSTWKVQCRMALMKDGLWNIVNGSERAPESRAGDQYAKFVAKSDRALAIIVLSLEPSLLYLLGDPESPVTVWKKLEDQFQKKSWANKLQLRRKLYSLCLKEGESVQEHVRAMIEIFESHSAIDDPVSEEDRVVYLLASLPDSFNMLVTAFEANPDVPKMEVVTERLLHEERKMKDRDGSSSETHRAMPTYRSKNKKPVNCHYCGKPGHIRRNCRIQIAEEEKSRSRFDDRKQKANTATPKDDSRSSSENDALIISHALSASARSDWIIDSGATCHMCNDEKLFTQLQSLKKPQDVTLGDGHELEATGKGVVSLEMKLPDGKTRKCDLGDALYVPRLTYNLLSVSKAAEAGKMTKFDETHCQILGTNQKVVAVATKVGSLYYLECKRPSGNQQINTAEGRKQESRESIWHRRLGHLGVQNLQKLARNNMVDGFDFNASRDLELCKTCIGGKHHRSPFETSRSSRSEELLGLVHSDVCGKLHTKSLGGAEYFLTFVDDKTHYVWIYPLKHKDEVFQRFLEWKALVEKSSGHKLKILRTDNGGEYTSNKFEKYLRLEGIRHECTVPKTPEQNGVAERLNRTLIETVRSMLIDANLPHKFWAEALATAVYLRNRSPTKAVEGVTPFEAWTKEKPKVDHLRVFGCDAYAHISKDERKKLDSKSRKCILVGYGQETKGYRLYDPKRERIIYSRDVKFNEVKQDPKLEPLEQETKHLVEIDFSNDSTATSSDDESEATADDPNGSAKPLPRRSERTRHPPDYYGVRVNVASEQPKEPSTLEEVAASPPKKKWESAMETEMQSLKDNDVWELVKLPEGRKAIGSKWVYKVKTGADGSIQRYKARLVAQGFSQKFGTDYDETFCPVIRLESFRTLVAFGVQHNLQLHHVDVTTAFLNGELEEEVYMKQPPGFVTRSQESLVCKLKKSIYGLKQSPRCWNSALHNQLKKMGFLQTTSDPCIYRDSEEEAFFIGVYVDDIILAGKNDKKMKDVKKALAKKFDIKDMGKLHYFLGMKVVQDEKTSDIWIGQPAYTEKVLKKFGMDTSKPVSTPVDANTKFVKVTEDEDCIDQQLYQSAIGSLLYLSVSTRPDIAYTVNNVANTNPTSQHWTGVKRIKRYLRGTDRFGICFTKQGSKDCVGYSDSDWAGDLDDQKSTSGYIFQISGSPVSWRSKKQSSVALSTAEAEYMALASASQEAMWLRQLTTELDSAPTNATTIFEDNQSAIAMTKNPQFHGRSKHIAIKYHFVREQVSNGTVRLEYCPTEEMTADMLTKGLYRNRFLKLRDKAGVREIPGHFVCK